MVDQSKTKPYEAEPLVFADESASPPQPPQRPRWWTPRRRLLAAIVIFAFLLRLAYVLTLSEQLYFPDSVSYVIHAESFLRGTGLADGGYLAQRTPVYPLILAACFAVFGKSFLVVRILQALVGALTCIVVYGVAGKIFKDPKVPPIAAAATAVYPFFVFFTGLLLTETLFIAALLGIVYLLLCLRDRHSWMLIGAVGLLLGLTVLLRPSLLLFIPFVIPFWLAVNKDKVRAFAAILGVCACALLALAPWIVRNAIVLRRFVPTTLTVGRSLYEAVGPQADGGPAMDKIVDPPEAQGLGEYKRDKLFRQLSWEAVCRDPVHFLNLAWTKLLRFWSLIPNYHAYQQPFYVLVSLASFVPVLLLSVYSFFKNRASSRTLLLVLSPVIYFSLLHMVFVGSVRYRIPVTPFLIVLGSGAFSAEVAHAAKTVRKMLKARLHIVAATFFSFAGLVVAVSLALAVLTNPALVRRRLSHALEDMLPGPVRLGAVEIHVFSRLKIEGLELLSEDPAKDPIFTAREVTIYPDKGSLLRGVWVARNVEILQPTFTVEMRRAGADIVTNVDKVIRETLRGAAGFKTAELPGRVAIHDGRVIVHDLVSPHPRDYVLDDISVTLDSSLPGSYGMSGWFRDETLGRVEVKGSLDVHERGLATRTQWSFPQPLALSDKLVEKMPLGLSETLADFHPSGAVAIESVTVAYEKAGDREQLDASLTARLDECRIEYGRFPYRFESVSGRLRVSRDRVETLGPVLINLDEAGDETLTVAGTVRGFSADGLLDLELHTLKPLVLDSRFRGLLRRASSHNLWHRMRIASGSAGPDLVRQWDRFNLQGSAMWDVHLTGTARRPQLQATVDFSDVSWNHDDFPYPLTSVSGRLDVTFDSLSWNDVVGTHGAASFTSSGAVEGLADEPRLDVSITGNDVALDADLARLLPASAQRFWSKYEPAGTVDLSINVTGRADAPLIEGLIQLRDCQFALADSGAAVENVSGRLSVRDTSLDLEASGRVLGSALSASGTIAMTPEGVSVEDLVVDVKAVELASPEIRSLLRSGPVGLWERVKSHAGSGRPPVRRIWDEYHPEGLADVSLAAEGPLSALEYKVAVRPIDVAVRYAYFPYAVGDIDQGEVEITKCSVALRDLSGMHGSTRIVLSGLIEERNRLPYIELAIDADRMHLDEDLGRALLLPDQQRMWKTLNPSGTVAVSYTARDRLPLPKERVTMSTIAEPSDVSVRLDKYGFEIGDIQAEVEFVDNRIIIHHMRGTEGDTELTVLPESYFGGLSADADMSFGVSVDDLRLSDKLLELLSEEDRSLIGSLELDGFVDLVTRLSRRAGSAEKPTVEMDITIAPDKDGVTLKDPRFPYEIPSIYGQLRLKNENLRVDLHSHFDDTKIAFKGRKFTWQDRRLPVWELQDLDVENLPLDDKFIAAWPPAMRRVFETIGLNGAIDVRLESAGVLRDAEKGLTRAEYNGRIDLLNVGFTMGAELSNILGRIRFQGAFNEYDVPTDSSESLAEESAPTPDRQSHRIEGDIDLARVSVQGKNVFDVGAAFVWEVTGNPADVGFDSMTFDVGRITGTAYRGTFSGDAKLTVQNDLIEYGISLALSDLSLEHFARDFLGYTGEEFSGTLDGEMNLMAPGVGLRDIGGNLGLSVSEGKLWKLPLVLALFSALNLSLPDQHAFTEATLDCSVRRGNIAVNELNFIGNALSLYGTGVITDGQIDLQFLTGLGRTRLPRLPLISDMVEFFHRQLVDIRVTGTLQNPQVEVMTLPIILRPFSAGSKKGDGAQDDE